METPRDQQPQRQFVDKKMAEMTGWERGRIVGEHIAHLVIPLTREKTVEAGLLYMNLNVEFATRFPARRKKLTISPARTPAQGKESMSGKLLARCMNAQLNT